jgi:hypothetical protein
VRRQPTSTRPRPNRHCGKSSATTVPHSTTRCESTGVLRGGFSTYVFFLLDFGVSSPLVSPSFVLFLTQFLPHLVRQ